MKCSTTECPTKTALLSKHAAKTTFYKRHLNKPNSCKSKSRYQHMKSCHEKDVQRVDTEKLEYLYKLRQEAYHDLHVQLQSYNDAFIARMQYMESNPAMSSDESQCSTDTDSPEMQSLVDMFEAGTVKDYSPLIEWEESYQNMPAYFQDQGQCGDLW
ncbi:hypothetical protein V8B55DRAFT_1515568 [Mucor lusitanicus]|uniref:Uncharacterized protein n=1 Tax=Mucor lusitanicus CBS 277.49 TaxID=747725 RepID=A0A168KXZ6_MUCCL|nr:hypothetical protein MUCCIDRAFT_162500 [Mucor lusitanicus CBS 277.49]